MKIIKSGHIPEPKSTIERFTCWHCGCIFEVDETEYRRYHTSTGHDVVVTECPHCAKSVFMVISD